MAQYRISGSSGQEIAASIERAIERGALAPGEALPSVRTIARELGVSPTTASAALGDLRSRGLVVTHERSRSRVSWRPPLGGALQRPSVPAGARDLASGNPDPSLLPDATPFLRRLQPPTQLYGDEPAVPGLLALAEAEFGATGIDGEALAVTSGALDGIERALQANTKPGDLVAVEDPGFAGLFDLLRALGLALRPVPIDDRGMVPDGLAAALAEGAAAVVLNPRGQNPTGASLDDRRARELRAVLAQAPGAMVVEDDHLGPIAGVPRVTLTAGRERWASTLSLAKSLGPDLRLAILAGDAQTISRVRGRQAVGPQWVSHLLQHLVAAMWGDKRVGAALARTADTYRDRREQFQAALAERGIEVTAPAGIAVWIPVPEEAPVVQALLAQGWAVMPGAPFRLQSPRAIRVTTSTLTAAEADGLAEAIRVALQPSSATRTA
ncbi:MAG TPA: aminotransferase class I/II-fold pyridoxal phosphate-dependent enzyme [Solirubrobacterales bacterium]|jgi:DNA-binding transcriptional MocR family regulator|nr:aminotransferase class I/II-fold pyridoxal phosphate-dependent enzyme [Solirubrobacterales bacterium]